MNMKSTESPLQQQGEFKSLSGAAVALIRRRIIDGQYQPGSKLVIGNISAELDISPGLVREALSRLVTEGLVIAHEQRGFRASEVSLKELQDITANRQMIETHALRLSIANGDAEWEAGIVAAFHRLKRSPRLENEGQTHAWSQLHYAFHRSLLMACGSPWMLRFSDLLFDQSERYRRLRFGYELAGAVPERDVDGEHQAIMDATLARDTDRAIELLARHYQDTAQRIIEQTDNSVLTGGSAR
ncbi:FCD domain-containing protein [Serratia marcescens]|uniref:GntR family transcriptional regulator n=1 Tax=Serratia marcescens TaxID=615 RepID=UPI001868C040|nr:FCD domain-containing protein [Serratia marcescens]MBN5271271.1 FCD domain-containing protein [Serratia marcescens]MBN5277309.1 FCD domain-containing protein [Serratia marcescens]MBN5305212.1 FCD domain-containing protein [Serratia marcescens]MBN5361813.1 FCD domain-containing protein [Serratia marcescens]MBN5419825.1 FCD domain-containing protein [Serratia marcescens]